MGTFLVLLAELFKRPKPRLQQRFEKILDKHGTQVVILAPTETVSGEHAYYPQLSTTAYVEYLTMEEEIVKAGQFTTEDVRGYFRAFTPIRQHDLIECGGTAYQVETVRKQYHIDRILWAEVLARKVIG